MENWLINMFKMMSKVIRSEDITTKDPTNQAVDKFKTVPLFASKMGKMSISYTQEKVIL
jgi:hypothetical protein